jgi:competence protein ComEC
MIDILFFRKVDSWVILTLLFFVVFDAFIWWQIIFGGLNKNIEIYFLDVGQGDSELVVLSNNVKILIDGGPDNKVVGELSSVLKPADRYIDLVILSHPQTDHFAGLIDVLQRYKVGAFISPGRSGPAQGFKDLEKTIRENKIPTIALGEGDKINYLDSRFDVLSPSFNLLQSAEPNDWGLALKMASGGIKALFAGDIDSKIEESLALKYDLDIDILKISHHGSKFSSSKSFLEKATPQISVIGVGKNSYGHPAEQTLKNLASIGSQIFRTDKDGTVKLLINNEQVNVFKKK